MKKKKKRTTDRVEVKTYDLTKIEEGSPEWEESQKILEEFNKYYKDISNWAKNITTF